MTDIYYPHDSLPMPLQEGYGFQPSPLNEPINHRRARQRGLYINADQASITWFMKLMRRLWRLKPGSGCVSDGAAWFMMKLQTPAGGSFTNAGSLIFITGTGGPDLLEVFSDA
jgi:hypothetical protein